MSLHYDVRRDCDAARRATAAYIDALTDELLPPMRAAARAAGYALAVHGSLARDIDIVAVPWTDQAISADKLLQLLVGVVSGVIPRAWATEFTDKPHGRRAATINHGGFLAEIDLSVMPVTSKETEA